MTATRWSKQAGMPLRLLPGDGVTGGEDGRYEAATPEPWLTVADGQAWRGRWMRLRYRTGLFDECVRPLICFRGRNGADQHVPMNGAITGVAEWIGRVPNDTVCVAICPVRRSGAFSFALDQARPVSRIGLVLRGLPRQPKYIAMALGARFIRAFPEAHHCLKFAALGEEMADYSSWYTARHRGFDLAGFDHPRADWNAAPRLHLILPLTDDAADLKRTLESVAAQSYPHWTLYAVGGASALFDAAMQQDQRFRRLDAASHIASLGGARDIAASLAGGDTLLPQAAALIVEQFALQPSLAACYGDEDRLTPEGQLEAPRFKPDWSPVFQAETGYAGAGVFLRLSAASQLGCETVGDLRHVGTTLPQLARDAVGHVRRLIHRRGVAAIRKIAPAGPSCSADVWPKAAIIVPTRDRPELLRACLDGVLVRTDYPDFELVLLDNGSVDPEALTLLAEARQDVRVRVLRAPGPFNYSALCNRGVTESDAPMLVFLNNDVVVQGSDWLKHLIRRAIQPQTGAVGALLLYPDGLVQHGGDVLGLGETAGHAFTRATLDTETYLDGLTNPREVTAVTGAVQALARTKFDAVGGFDAERFPVLLNDTDLCLKLAAQGYISLYEPAASLIHAESASRGFKRRPFTFYARERGNFIARWLPVIRDDPYFHPALSLYACIPRLG